MSLAYPGEKSSMAEHIARDAFLTAIDDPELELEIREREPKDFESSVKLAQRRVRQVLDTSSTGILTVFARVESQFVNAEKL